MANASAMEEKKRRSRESPKTGLQQAGRQIFDIASRWSRIKIIGQSLWAWQESQSHVGGATHRHDHKSDGEQASGGEQASTEIHILRISAWRIHLRHEKRIILALGLTLFHAQSFVQMLICAPLPSLRSVSTGTARFTKLQRARPSV